MAQENRSTLKTYFETGDKPTQSQFVNLLDSLLNLVDAGITEAEAGYLAGVTSAIQTQLNAKAPTASPTFTGTVILPGTADQLVYLNASKQLTSIEGYTGTFSVAGVGDLTFDKGVLTGIE